MQPVIDPAKIAAKLDELNGAGPLPGLIPAARNWIAPDGFYSLTTMSFTGSIPTFNANAGIPLKIFVNVRTGEIKIFDARIFFVTPNSSGTPPTGTN